jgi:hypothetical protein
MGVPVFNPRGLRPDADAVVFAHIHEESADYGRFTTTLFEGTPQSDGRRNNVLTVANLNCDSGGSLELAGIPGVRFGAIESHFLIGASPVTEVHVLEYVKSTGGSPLRLDSFIIDDTTFTVRRDFANDVFHMLNSTRTNDFYIITSNGVGASAGATFDYNAGCTLRFAGNNRNVLFFAKTDASYATPFTLNASNRWSWDPSGQGTVFGGSIIGALTITGDFTCVELIQTYNRTYSLQRTMPTVVNDVVDIGSWSQVNSQGVGQFDITVSIMSGGWAQTKRYVAGVFYHATAGAWQRLAPISTTGIYGGAEDFEVDISSSAYTTSLRIRRTAGSTAGTATVTMVRQGLLSDTFTASTATASVAAPGTTFNRTKLTVTGSRGGNAALASLLTQLQTAGLITDSSS